MRPEAAGQKWTFVSKLGQISGILSLNVARSRNHTTRKMGIVAYYLDVDAVQLTLLKARPELVWNIASDPRFAKARMIDNDKDWEVLSWLASSNKRTEKCHEVAWRSVSEQEAGQKASREEFKRLVAKSVNEFGCPPEPLESDALLKAIEGRGTKKEREPRLDYGLGAARLFQPGEVKSLAVSFAKLDFATLRKHFDRKEMARFDVGGIDWENESDGVFDEFLAPSFSKLSSFYQRAAKLNHYVLVIYQ